MTSRLSQIIAVEKGAKTDVYAQFSKAHHDLQKVGPLSGISRTYQKKNDEGEDLPPESTKVQISATETIDEVGKILTRLFDVTATKEWGNTGATADVVVDGEVLLAKVPVTYLLFLEKQVRDVEAFVKKLPLLDPAETWEWDDTANAYRAQAVETVRTKKIPRNHVKAPATDKHPAQVEVYSEDVVVGTWRTVKFSGAMEASEVKRISERVTKLSEAVKYAREQANMTEVADIKVGTKVFDYLFG